MFRVAACMVFFFEFGLSLVSRFSLSSPRPPFARLGMVFLFPFAASFVRQVAERLDLPAFVVERARSLLDDNTRQVRFTVLVRQPTTRQSLVPTGCA